jgi:hypothetical protein
MNIWFYDAARQFLERKIETNPENAELVKAYAALISKFAEIEIKYFENNTDYNKNYDKNQAEVKKNYQTAQAEIIKKQVEKGAVPVDYNQSQI